MNVKQSVAGDDEAHLVFIVPVLATELRQHRLQTGCSRLDIDHIGGDIAATNFQRLDLLSVCAQDLVAWRIKSHRMCRSPPFIIDADTPEVGSDLIIIAQGPIIIADCYQRHSANSNALNDRFSSTAR